MESTDLPDVERVVQVSRPDGLTDIGPVRQAVITPSLPAFVVLSQHYQVNG
jgi:hypothetical protein